MILNNLTTTFRKAATQAFRTPARRPEKMKANEPNIKAVLMYLDEAIDKYAEALQRDGFNMEIVKGKSGDVIVITPNPVSTSCTSPDPDDMCKNCTCWKATRKNCS